MRNNNEAITLFDGSKLWEDYKKLYDEIKNARTPDEVSRIADVGWGILTNLMDSAPAYRETVRDLNNHFTTKINGRRDGLQSQHGKRPKLDFFIRLRFVLERLQIENRLMETFLKEKVKDPWVYSRIYEGLKQSQTEIASAIERVNEEVANGVRTLTESDKNDLVEAAKAISRAKAIIDEREKR